MKHPTRSYGNFDFQQLGPKPVGSYPRGASAFGVHDIVGNGWEWTRTEFAPFPGFHTDAVLSRLLGQFF